MAMGDFPYAQAFRDVIREFIDKELNNLRPTSSFATVDTINTVAGTCNVIFPGDVISVPVKMYAIQPSVGGGIGVGDVVQIEGESGKRYVTRVVNGRPMIAAGKVAISAIETTGASSNMYIDPATGLVSRSTSSLRYKKLIQDITPLDTAILGMRVITYESITEGDNNRYLGLVAEELAGSNNEFLRYLVAYDKDGNPDSVNYDRVSMIVIPAVQRILGRMTDFAVRLGRHKDRLDADDLDIAANTTSIGNLRGRIVSLETDLAAALLRISALEAVKPPPIP